MGLRPTHPDENNADPLTRPWQLTDLRERRQRAARSPKGERVLIFEGGPKPWGDRSSSVN